LPIKSRLRPVFEYLLLWRLKVVETTAMPIGLAFFQSGPGGGQHDEDND